MFRPSSEALNDWLFSQSLFHGLYDDSDDSGSDDGNSGDHTRVPRAKRSCKSVYSVEDRYNSFFYRTYLSPAAKEAGIEKDDSWLGKKFRRRFRVPFSVFMEICKDFERLNGKRPATDRAGIETVPLELLVLGALRVLGSGCTFEAVEELTCVAEGTHRLFFHNEFCVWGVRASDEHIKMPESEEEIKHVVKQYEERGFPGCVGSVDCVHLVWDKCPAELASACNGKGSFPTLAFQVVCSNRRKIMSCSNYFYGATNDKTIAMADEVSLIFIRIPIFNIFRLTLPAKISPHPDPINQ